MKEGIDWLEKEIGLNKEIEKIEISMEKMDGDIDMVVRKKVNEDVKNKRKVLMKMNEESEGREWRKLKMRKIEGEKSGEEIGILEKIEGELSKDKLMRLIGREEDMRSENEIIKKMKRGWENIEIGGRIKREKIDRRERKMKIMKKIGKGLEIEKGKERIIDEEREIINIEKIGLGDEIRGGFDRREVKNKKIGSFKKLIKDRRRIKIEILKIVGSVVIKKGNKEDLRKIEEMREDIEVEEDEESIEEKLED